MALIICPECGKQYSNHAEKCPQCGLLQSDIKLFLQKQEEEKAKQLAEQKRLKEEAQKKAAEAARARAEKRAQWWKKNYKWIIGLVVITLLSIAGYFSYLVYCNKKSDKEYALASKFLYEENNYIEAEKHVSICISCAKTVERQYGGNNLKYRIKEMKVTEFRELKTKLEILLDADDYVFNKHSRECLQRMAELFPQDEAVLKYQRVERGEEKIEVQKNEEYDVNANSGATIPSSKENNEMASFHLGTKPNFSGTYYSVVVGAYTSKEEARMAYQELKDNGFKNAYSIPVKKNGTWYNRMIAGSYRDKDDAVALKSRLVNMGYSVWISKD